MNISGRVRACNYLVVAQLFLQDNYLLERPLSFDDIKPRLLGHWGTCPGINFAYACLGAHFASDPNYSFVLGPGHGFPALQANLFLDGELAKVDPSLKPDYDGLAKLCHDFSWPGGFPSHASPLTPGVICEGGELGYALATSYGFVLGRPERTVAVLIGDGEFETATTLGSLNLNHLLSTPAHGRVLPILHLNGYKISAPTLAARKSERELHQLLRGFGYTPLVIDGPDPDRFATVLEEAKALDSPFLILKTEKGMTGPNAHQDSHQIPLKNPKSDPAELQALEDWLRSYHFEELFDKVKGFTL